MITAEPWAVTQARRKRLAASYPELAHSTPSEIAEVDGAYPDRLPTAFTQEQVRLANYARDASPDVEDAAPNVLPWTPSGGPLTTPAADPYSREALSTPAMPPEQGYYRDDVYAGRVAGREGPLAGAMTLVDLGAPARSLVLNTLQGKNPFEQTDPWVARGIDTPGIRDLPDVGPQIGPVHLTPRTVAGFGAEALADPTTILGSPGVDDAARFATRGAGRARTWLEAADAAAAASSGAAEAAVRAAQPEAFQFGRGTLDEAGALRERAVRPDDMIPRRTLLEPEGRQLGAQVGGAELPQPETLVALRDRKLAEGLTPQQIMTDPEVQEAMARVFAPDRNAIPDGPATASDITVNLRRAREQDARAVTSAGSAPVQLEAPASPEFPGLTGDDALQPGEYAPVPKGARVDGRLVRDRLPNTDSISASLGDDYYELRGVREVQMADFQDAAEPVTRDARTLKLAEEIRESGELNPLIVVMDDQGPYILEGGHRYQALRALGAKSFPAIVVEDTTKTVRYPGAHVAPKVPEFPLQGGGVAGGSQELDNPAFARLPEQPSAVQRSDIAEPLAQGESGRVPLESIRTRPELFQARDVAPGQSFDERRVQELVSEWNPERLDPITVARDPEGGYVVTSGHHRLEAARRVGMDDIPVRVADVDLRSAAGQRTAQREAILSNFSVAEQNVRERVRAFEALAQDGMSPDEIGAAARMSADRVQRTLDIGTAGRQVVERVTQNPTLEGVAAEVGRFRRLHGLSDEDAAGTFNALVTRGKGESIPSTPSVRRMLDRLAPAFENRQLPGFEGQGFGGDPTPLYEAVREGARLQDELTSASRRVASEVQAVERLGERAGVDVSALRDLGQRELDALSGQLANLEQSVMQRVRAQAAERGQGRLGAVATSAENAPVQPLAQEGPDLFANAGIDRMERPTLPASDAPTRPQAGLPREILDIKGPEASWLKRGADFLTDVANVPRSLMSSLDLSGSLRQGGWLAPRHNREWRGAFKAQLRSLGSEEAAQAVQREINEAPLASWRPDTLYMTDWGGNDLNKLEEQFASRMAGRFPGVKQTARAYAVMLNKLRADTFDSFVAQLTPEQRTPQRLAQYARYVNAATGRGSLPQWLETFAPALNAAFFSPRFLVSIPQRHLAAFTRDPLVRKEVLKDMAGFYGTGMTLIGSLVLAEQAGLLPGVHVETDYNSPDWGKAVVGKTSIDIWGGQQQYARMLARATASTPGWLQGKNKPGDNPINIMAQFLRYKFAPIPNAEEQLRTGTTALGEQQGVGETLIRNATPLLLQELHDAYAEGGAGAAALTLPSALGVGVSTYERGAPASSGGRATQRPPRVPRPARPATRPRPQRPARPVPAR